MNKKNKSSIHLDNTTLEALRSDVSSCVEVKTLQHHIILHPFHLTSVGESIKEILNSRISKYNKAFKSILLGYQNVKILGYEAPMTDDTCFMHSTIEADFFLFKPTVGSTLTGIVNKKSNDHIGCLVHKLFNVSLPKPHGETDWLGHKVDINQEIQFRVTFTDLDARLPYIRGEIISSLHEDSGISTSEEAQQSPKRKHKSKSKTSQQVPADESPKKKSKKVKKEVKEEQEEIEDVKQKKKSKKNKKSKEETSVSEEVIIKTEVLPELEGQEPLKKKKKKRKSSEKLEENCPLLDVIIKTEPDYDTTNNAEDISKKKKKRKLVEVENDADLLTPPKKAKKKKHSST